MKSKLSIAAVMLSAMILGTQCGFAAPANQKPGVKILATGGTIAGSAASKTATSGYKAGSLGIDVLMEAVPEIQDYAKVSGEQVCNISSNNMTDELWLKLSKRVNELAAQKDVNGIVVTHGTDTLEETAYFLDLTVKSDKPVILTGAMRPATAISADGPMNLLNSVRLAADKKAGGNGVMVLLNDEIDNARDVTKSNTTSVDTFKSHNGPLGFMNDGVPDFYNKPLRLHTTKTPFDVRNLTSLPKVYVIYGTAGADGSLVDAAVKAGAKGIVYAGTGNGSIHQQDKEALIRAAKAGVVVVRSSRTGSGMVVPEPEYAKEGFLDGDSLNPQKARILLQLALTKTHDLGEIQSMFHKY